MRNGNESSRQSKTALLNSQILVHFDPEVDIVLACDASCYGIGAVLSHCYADGREAPIAVPYPSLKSGTHKLNERQ